GNLRVSKRRWQATLFCWRKNAPEMAPMPRSERELADRICRDLESRSDTSLASMRGVRRHWSAVLRNEPPQTVLAAALDLFERFPHRWPAYELVLFHPTALELLDAPLVVRFGGLLGSWGGVDQFGVLLAGPAWRAGRIQTSLIHEWAKGSDRWWRR